MTVVLFDTQINASETRFRTTQRNSTGDILLPMQGCVVHNHTPSIV